MVSPEYGMLFLAAAVFLLFVFLLTQIGPGRRKSKESLVDEETEATERFLRSVAPTEASPRGGMLQKMDGSFADIIHRADLKMTPDQALGAMVLAGTLLATALYFWKEEVWLAVVGFFTGMALIFAYYLVKQLGYRRRLFNQIPDAFFLIARSVRSGLSLEQAIDLAAQQGLQPLAGEFKQAAQQIKLGLSIPAALQRMAFRIKLLDFDAFVSTVAVYSRTGGNLPLLLDRLAAAARDHFQFRGYFAAATAQARITAVSIGLVAPLLILGYLFLDPEHLQTLLKDEIGWSIIAGCFALELVGAFWLYRMLKVDYY
jgi:tight adherence protein B